MEETNNTNRLQKGQLVYWVRKSTESVESIRVHSIQPDYFTAIELKGQRTFLFSWRYLDETVFIDPVEAEMELEVAKQKWREQHHEPVKGSLSYVLRGVKEDSED